MGKFAVCAGLMLFPLMLLPDAQATNGDILFGVAPAARAMGGTGVAAPQDAISAIFANPAAICMGPYCPGSQTVFASTLYTPTTKATVEAGGVVNTAKSDMKPFVIPAIGVIIPYSDQLRFGFGMFGIAGMGVDYRSAGLPDLNPSTPENEGDIYTQVQVMKFAPNVAWLVTPDFSIGASLHLLYASLDLGQGMSHNYAVGGQVGAIYKIDSVSLGVSYTTPEEATHEKVSDFGIGIRKEDLSLESPHNIAVGVAWRPTDKLLVEADLKWLNWANASGYKDFDWDNQWVYAVGVQYKNPVGLILRGGYNYGKNPVKIHDGFNSDPMDTTVVQGKALNTTSYEYMRIIGFPAVAEHHFTLGVGYRFDSSFEAHIGVMYALNSKISERDVSGTLGFKSELQETSYDVGLVWSFF